MRGCHGAAGHGMSGPIPGDYRARIRISRVGWLKASASGASGPAPGHGTGRLELSENDMKAVAEYIAGLR